jgi:hypothetical protein
MEQGCTALSAASLVHRQDSKSDRPKYASRTRLVPEAVLPMFERAACPRLATTSSSNATTQKGRAFVTPVVFLLKFLAAF